MATNQLDGLWMLGFGEVGATLKGMQDAGVTPELLARFRSNNVADRLWAKEIAQIMLKGPQVSATIPELSKTVFFELQRTVDVAAWEVFKAREFFVESGQSDGINFCLGDSLKANFLIGDGKVELDVPAATLSVFKLNQNSKEGPIFDALGINTIVKTRLAYLAQLIKKQPQGQYGALLTNGLASIFYVEDPLGRLWFVSCSWFLGSGEWRVYAFPTTSLLMIADVHQFLFPTVLLD